MESYNGAEMKEESFMGHFKDSTIYQIYTKSFQDTTGNGLGDIRGVISRLDYLKELGIDYIWLTPFFCSPLNDGSVKFTTSFFVTNLVFLGITPLFQRKKQ